MNKYDESEKWLQFKKLALEHFNELASPPVMQFGDYNSQEALINKFLTEIQSFCTIEECIKFERKYNNEVAGKVQ